MDKWRVTLQAWPHSTGRGADQDQKDAGEREQTYTVHADTLERAAKAAAEIARAVESNPMVWQAPIMRLERITS